MAISKKLKKKGNKTPKSKALDRISKAISFFGRYYNGFEAHGVENIPLDRPALIVFYHGFMPLDAWYFGMQFYWRWHVNHNWNKRQKSRAKKAAEEQK